MRDQLDAQMWVAHHEGFSADVDRALAAIKASLSRFAAWDGTTHQLLALALSFAITALTFSATTSPGA